MPFRQVVTEHFVVPVLLHEKQVLVFSAVLPVELIAG
jgi:hypothetical protein